jgi:hypothetical protein
MTTHINWGLIAEASSIMAKDCRIASTEAYMRGNPGEWDRKTADAVMWSNAARQARANADRARQMMDKDQSAEVGTVDAILQAIAHPDSDPDSIKNISSALIDQLSKTTKVDRTLTNECVAALKTITTEPSAADTRGTK